MTRSSESASPKSASARAEASIEAWQRKLLDLSKRNRAVNYKPTRVSTIQIVDERPAEVFRHLVVQEKSMAFSAIRDVRPEIARDEETQLRLGAGVSSVEDYPEDEPPELREADPYVPYEVASLDRRHTDDELQTALGPEQLDRALRRLDQVARTSIEEQGVNTLFL